MSDRLPPVPRDDLDMPYPMRSGVPPLAVCSECGRASWSADDIGRLCEIRRPDDDGPCVGRLSSRVKPHPRPAPDRPPLTANSRWAALLMEKVETLRYKDGWRFALIEQSLDFQMMRASLVVEVEAEDSEHKGRTMLVRHVFPTPFSDMMQDEKFVRRWLLDCILQVETHEACEFYEIDGEKPFFPPHDGTGSPYAVREREREAA